MTRWTLDPEGAAAALIAGVTEEQPFEAPVLWAGVDLFHSRGEDCR